MIRASAAVVVKRRVQASLLILLALLIAVLATGMLATYNLYRSAEDRYIGVVLPLRGLTRDVLFQMKREESGVRGYMITKNRNSLKLYLDGRKDVLDGPHEDHGAHARARAPRRAPPHGAHGRPSRCTASTTA